MIDAIWLRGIERIVIVLAGAAFGWMGYRLFLHGHKQGQSKMSFDSPWAKVVFSGTGAGLIFMAFGACVLLYALIFGGVRTTERNTVQSLQKDVADLQQNIKEVEMLVYKPPTAPANQSAPAPPADRPSE